MEQKQKQAFTNAYIECMLWAENLDNISADEISRDALDKIDRDCKAFLTVADRLLTKTPKEYTIEQAGHDLWLTRNGHGTGFWDRGITQGEDLTTIAQSMGECDLFIQDGNLYID